MKEIDLRCGNAAELLKTLETESIDLIVADPPYNLSKDYEEAYEQALMMGLI